MKTIGRCKDCDLFNKPCDSWPTPEADGCGDFEPRITHKDGTTMEEKMLTVEKNRPTHEELKAAAMPILELLYKYYHPHAYAIINECNVEIVVGDMSAPLPLRD